MKLNLFTIIIIGLMLSGSNVSNAFEIIVPPDANIVQKADLIISGIIGFNDANEPLIKIEQVYKGDVNGSENVRLKLKDAIFRFSLPDYLKPYQGKQVIVLGKYDQTNQTLILPWWVASIWPYRPHGNEILFPPETYKDSEDFLVAMVEYIELGGKDKDLLINKLLDDVNLPSKRYAVLGYSREILPKLLNDIPFTEQFCAALMAEIVSNNITDPYTVNNVAFIYGLMPPSVCARYLIEASFREENVKSELAFNRAKNILIRDFNEKKKIKTPKELEAIFIQKQFSLEMSDAIKALKMFDSINQRLRQSADKVLGIILKDSAKPDESVRDKKEYWQQKIEQRQQINAQNRP